VKKVLISLIMVTLVFSMISCSDTGNGENKEPENKWEGDNMEDFIAEGLEVSDKGAGIYPRVPYEERFVGLAYTTWFRPQIWSSSVWAYPTLGTYNSDDKEIIRQHAELIYDAGVDFVWVDWSNNLDFDMPMDRVLKDRTSRADFAMIERSTVYMFDVYSQMEKAPKISIFIGCPAPGQKEGVTDGRLTRKADQIYDWFVNNPEHPEYKDQLFYYNGKPLLVVYVGTPSPWQSGVPEWDDDRFTVRYMTGYVTEQKGLRDPDTLESKYGYWSWEDRVAQTFTVSDGYPEAMIVCASTRPQAEEGDPNYIPAVERRNGQTFKEQWARARLIGVRFAMVSTWNEYVTGEQYSDEVSKDIEPNTVWGDMYLKLLKEEIAKFKGKNK